MLPLPINLRLRHFVLVLIIIILTSIVAAIRYDYDEALVRLPLPLSSHLLHIEIHPMGYDWTRSAMTTYAITSELKQRQPSVKVNCSLPFLGNSSFDTSFHNTIPSHITSYICCFRTSRKWRWSGSILPISLPSPPASRTRAPIHGISKGMSRPDPAGTIPFSRRRPIHVLPLLVRLCGLRLLRSLPICNFSAYWRSKLRHLI